jgi:predicted DNA-binding transcriptional regulator AlpA
MPTSEGDYAVPHNRPSERTHLPTRLVLTRYAIVDRTLDRWLADPGLMFPRPLMIKGRRYFFLDEIEEWERVQARKNSGRGGRPVTAPAAR